ncbi:hypothetical protein [Pantoea phage LIMEzero]|uniref:Uncharacterized protein n=1 Tax=Pantoea phage LIMEzero TaxID=943335 RepID=F4N9R3_9CAUD|nr:hypothetical protein LIMEzero_ORF10 [Pantoea phage LIMEzero]CBY88541.1 hypothetical protein [Pantoea phage LIMEzero]
MAIHKVRIMRGVDYEDEQPIVALRFTLPDGKEGLTVFNRMDVLGVDLDLVKATDQQMIDRIKEYAGSLTFIIDLLNDRCLAANVPYLERWQRTLTTIYEGDMYLFGIDDTLEK